MGSWRSRKNLTNAVRLPVDRRGLIVVHTPWCWRTCGGPWIRLVRLDIRRLGVAVGRVARRQPDWSRQHRGQSNVFIRGEGSALGALPPATSMLWGQHEGMCWGPTASVGRRPSDKNVGKTSFSTGPRGSRVVAVNLNERGLIMLPIRVGRESQDQNLQPAPSALARGREKVCVDSAGETVDARTLSGMGHPARLAP